MNLKKTDSPKLYTIPDSEIQPEPCMAPDSPIEDHEALEQWDHPRAMDAIDDPGQFLSN